MTEDEIPTDAPLYRCVYKKSVSVTKYLARQAGWLLLSAIILILVMAFIAAVGMWVVIPVGTTVLAVAIAVGEATLSFLFSIPWYCYAGVAAIAAIPIYSLLWCIARKLIEEDWKSKEAESIAFVIALAAIVTAFAFVLAAILTLAAIVTASAILTLAAIVTAFAFVTAAILADSKIFRFPGAYLHYRERVADTKFSRTVETAKENR